MFINLSNHPSARWSAEQTEAARAFGDIVDLPFPVVDPQADEADVAAVADAYTQKVIDLTDGVPATVHLMGEMSLTFALISRLKTLGYRCLESTTMRETVESPDGVKTSVFRFVRFRNYE